LFIEKLKDARMKISKRQLRRIIKEEKARILREQPYSPEPGSHSSADGPMMYKVTMVVALEPGQEEYILNSIEDGMEFDEEAGEGIVEYNVQPVGVPR
jgi:hypothetical protein